MVYSKHIGNNFEKIFEFSCHRANIAITRFPDGCKTLGQNKIIRVKTPWDWIISKDGKVCFIDTKTCVGNKFSHSAIELHQVTEMLKHTKQGVRAGYVIWLRSIDKVIYAPAELLYERTKESGSIRLDHASLTLGSILTTEGLNPTPLFEL